MIRINLDGDLGYPEKSAKHTHTTANTAEEVSGFDSGAYVRVWSPMGDVWVGGSKVHCENHTIGTPEGVPAIFKLAGSTLWVDAEDSSDVVYFNQVRV